MADTPSELEAQIQTLQDEVDLLKTEIKQTLIDMRELVMKDSNIFAQPSSSKVNSEIRQIPPTVTEENLSELKIDDAMVAVYLPHSYNFSGNLYVVPSKNIKKIDYHSGKFMKFIVSGGVTSLGELEEE